jgi:hypothetical protein
VRWLDPALKGTYGGILVVVLPATIATLVGPRLAVPAGVLQTAAGIGASFVLGYAIEATWLSDRMLWRKQDEGVVGTLTGFALCGIVAIGLLLASSAQPLQRENQFFLWTSFVSLGLLGILVACQPLLAHLWTVSTREMETQSD